MKMKKLTAVFTAFALTATLLAGCGGGDNTHDKLTKYVEKNQEQITQMNDVLGDSMNISVEVDEETLVMLVTLNMEISADQVEATKASLETSAASMEAQFESFLKELEKEAKGANAVIRYVDSAGQELAIINVG